MNTFLLIGLFLAAALASHTFVVWLAARLSKLPRRAWSRALLIVVVRFVVVAGVWMLIATFSEHEETTMQFWTLAVMADVPVSALLIWRLCRGKLPAMFFAWSGQYLGSLLICVLLVFMVRPFLETLIGHDGAMSPNIRKFHVVEVLPNGNHLVVNAPGPERRETWSGGGMHQTGSIVEETGEFAWVVRPWRHTHGPDRLICNKTRFPNRWEIVVFHWGDPKSLWIRRLIGLPGERIGVDNGSIWIDGTRTEVPDRIGPIHFDKGFRNHEGTPSYEILLGPGEYLLLPDNKDNSDSWASVGRDRIIGVVDVIYWPPSRWRLNP